MVTIFNNSQDIEKAISIIEWSRQYMELNQAHISKIGHVEASLVILRRTNGALDIPADQAALVVSTLKNCIKFYDLNSATPVDKAWADSLTALKTVPANWF